MKQVKTKITFLILFFVFVDVFSLFGMLYEKRIAALETIIEKKEQIISGKNQNILNSLDLVIEREEQYKESIERIMVNIQRTDTFLNIGGGIETKGIANFDSIVRILEGTSDYDDFLHNVDNYFIARRELYNQMPNIWPVKNNQYNRITSSYGDRFVPYEEFLVVQEHRGIDIASEWLAPIVATADGVVAEHWIYHPTFGRLIIIDHGNGFKTTYGHLAKSFIHEGWQVKKGQTIGLMGASGLTTGTHLHYEVRQNGVAVDPINFMRSFAE